MKRLIISSISILLIGVIVFVLMNSLNIRPLDFEKNDPNSNALLIGLVFFVVGAILFGGQANADRMLPSSTVEYLRNGKAEELKKANLRSPFAFVSIFLGVIFIIVYLLLNRQIK